MANEPVVTVVGNAVADPELRFLPSGVAVCNLTIASTPRVKDGDAWVDGEAMFVRCAVWRRAAENVAETVTKGMRLMVQGRLKVRSYESNGEKRTSIEMDVDAIGPELTFAVAKVQKVTGSPRATASVGADPFAGQGDDGSPPF